MTQAAESGSVESHAAFGTTHWSVVIAAGQLDAPRSQEAWETLAQKYWQPLHAYIRRSGYTPENARDLTQSFFGSLIERRTLDGVVPGNTKFRSFLLACLNNFLTDEFRHAQAARRRPKEGWISMDSDEADCSPEPEFASRATPESIFERRWAEVLLDRATVRLRSYYVDQGKTKLFERLVAHLTKEPDAIPHLELAAELNTSEAAIRSEMYRLRQRYRLLFRDEVAATVPPNEVKEEMRHIYRVLSQ